MALCVTHVPLMSLRILLCLHIALEVCVTLFIFPEEDRSLGFICVEEAPIICLPHSLSCLARVCRASGMRSCTSLRIKTLGSRLYGNVCVHVSVRNTEPEHSCSLVALMTLRSGKTKPETFFVSLFQVIINLFLRISGVLLCISG